MFAVRLPHSWDAFDLERFPVANYIIFKDDLESTLEGSRRKLEDARKALRGHGIDPIFMMDEEGGRVTQISGFFPSAPSPRAISKTLSPEEAATVYGQVAASIAHLGIDLNLFPCVDVNTEPLNPIIGTRSFGNTAGRVSAFARAAIASSRRHVGCVAKHFPGHGMTLLDSHLGLPAVGDSRETFGTIHLKPFEEAARLGVDGIMVSHCVYSSMQSDGLPASLSWQIVADWLRMKTNYGGLVITDSLDMKSVTRALSAPEAALLAIEATCDILLYTEYSERFTKSFEIMVDLLLMERLEQDRLMESVKRREKLLTRLRTTRGVSHIFEEDVYFPLIQRVRANCFSMEDPGQILPLSCGDAVLAGSSPGIAPKMRAYIPGLVEACQPSDSAGRTLILWITEPLALNQSANTLRALVQAAARSVLVTTYETMAKAFRDCQVKVVTDDTSPHMEDLLLGRLFRRPA